MWKIARTRKVNPRPRGSVHHKEVIRHVDMAMHPPASANRTARERNYPWRVRARAGRARASAGGLGAG